MASAWAPGNARKAGMGLGRVPARPEGRRAKTKEAFQIEGDQQDVTSDLKCTPG